jgi:hypothetical protein
MRIRVTFDLYLPEGTPEKAIQTWLERQLDVCEELASGHPLAGEGFDPRNIEWEER